MPDPKPIGFVPWLDEPDHYQDLRDAHTEAVAADEARMDPEL